MSEGDGQRIRVILRMVQIHDDLEPAWEDEGEFRFNAKVSSRNRGGLVQETVMPSPESGEKFFKVRDNPAWNRLKLDKVLFDGVVDDHLEVELIGTELDLVGPDDHLDPYHRVFEGDPATWAGLYHPGDEGSDDPERMSNWWIYLEVETA